MFLKNNGNVGIGTTAPANLLDIGTGGGIHIASGLPGSTSMALYNNSGTLTWNGAVVSTGGSSISGTTNYIPVFTSTTSLGNSVMYQSGSNIGIGTTSPPHQFVSYSSTSGYVIQGIGDGLSSAGINMDDYANVPTAGGGIAGRFSRGSYASPSAVQVGDRLGYLLFVGYDGSALIDATSIEGHVDSGTVSSTSLPSYISFQTEPNGSITRSERMRIDENGNVGIETTSPQATLDVNGFARLKLNSSAPATCSSSNEGSIAMTHLAQVCVCDTTPAWHILNTSTACSW